MAYDENIRIIAEELERVKNRPTGDKLPEVESTDEGKVLTVNSSGEWDAEDLPDQLPDVDSTDEGKVLTVSSEGKWVPGDATSGGYNITSTEVKTNKQYNNKDVYVKAFPSTFSGTGGWATLIEMPDYIDDIISADLICRANQNPCIVNALMLVEGTNLRMYNPGSFSASDSVLILEYTKKTTNKKKGAK